MGGVRYCGFDFAYTYSMSNAPAICDKVNEVNDRNIQSEDGCYEGGHDGRLSPLATETWLTCRIEGGLMCQRKPGGSGIGDVPPTRSRSLLCSEPRHLSPPAAGAVGMDRRQA
jgi:hypothetical protein